MARPAFQVRFWGVRGSIPTPGSSTRLVGGNTSCVEVRVGSTVLVLDSGSGARALGESLAAEGIQPTLLFSHVHWDHILGFPYFRPAAQEGNELLMFGERKAGTGIDEILAYQAGQAHAPLVVPGKGARVRFEPLAPGDELALGDALVKVARMNHPDGCVAYRIENEGRAVVYATDTEHSGEAPDRKLLELAAGADALIYDAMYTEEEYQGEIGGSKKGWGHSTWKDGVKVAKAADVKHFFLFHHEPGHDDRFIARLEKEARAFFPGAIAAKEHLVYDAAADKVRQPRALSQPALPARMAAKRARR